MDNQETTSGGIGFLSLLTIAFIVLKLTGSINWSWLWVLAPTWIPLAIILLIVIGIIIRIVIVNKNRRKR